MSLPPHRRLHGVDFVLTSNIDEVMVWEKEKVMGMEKEKEKPKPKGADRAEEGGTRVRARDTAVSCHASMLLASSTSVFLVLLVIILI
jgi:hypothetical protein